MKLTICTLLCTMLLSLTLAEPLTGSDQVAGKNVAKIVTFDVTSFSAGMDAQGEGTYMLNAYRKDWNLDLWAWQNNHPEARIGYTAFGINTGKNSYIDVEVGLNQKFGTSVQKAETSISPGVIFASANVFNGISQINVNANFPISKNSNQDIGIYSHGVCHWILSQKWAVGLEEEFRSERNNLILIGPIVSYMPNSNSAIALSYLTNGHKNHEIRLSLTLSREN